MLHGLEDVHLVVELDLLQDVEGSTQQPAPLGPVPEKYQVMPKATLSFQPKRKFSSFLAGTAFFFWRGDAKVVFIDISQSSATNAFFTAAARDASLTQSG